MIDKSCLIISKFDKIFGAYAWQEKEGSRIGCHNK